MTSILEALTSTNPKEAQAHYAKMELLCTKLRAEREEDIKAKQDKSHTDWANMYANREKRRADMKAFNEMMERREAERKTYEETMMAEWEADQKKKKKKKKKK
jgi:hypothetical protein